MIGNGFWSTGISVKFAYSGGGEYGWAAEANFFDAGFCNDDVPAGRISTEGTLRTRYPVRDTNHVAALAAAVDAVKVDAERMGVRWGVDGNGGTVYMENDGEDLPAESLPPGDWREHVNAQARRLDWAEAYGDDVAEVSR